MDKEKAEELATTLASGRWTHDYPISFEEAKGLGLPVSNSIPTEVALHQKSGSYTRGGSSTLNKPPLLVVACNFGARLVEGERLVGIISEADIRIDEGPLVQ